MLFLSSCLSAASSTGIAEVDFPSVTDCALDFAGREAKWSTLHVLAEFV